MSLSKQFGLFYPGIEPRHRRLQRLQGFRPKRRSGPERYRYASGDWGNLSLRGRLLDACLFAISRKRLQKCGVELRVLLNSKLATVVGVQERRPTP